MNTRRLNFDSYKRQRQKPTDNL